MRSDDWKLVLPRPANPPGTGWWGRMIDEVKEPQLYNLRTDPAETTNVAEEHPEVVAELQEKIKDARTELGDRDVVGKGVRDFDNKPRKLEAMGQHR